MEAAANSSLSYVNFGGDLSNGYTGSLNTVNVSSYKWFFNSEDLQYGTEFVNSRDVSIDTYIETGNSNFLTVDKKTWKIYKKYFSVIDGFTCDSKGCMSEQPCSYSYGLVQPFTIQIGSKNYTVPSQGYLIDINQTCMIGITSSENSALGTEYVFGTYFLLSFYASFNYDKVSVNLAVNSRNTGWTATITKLEPLMPWWAWTLIFTGLMVVTIVGTCLIFRCLKKKKHDNEVRERLYTV